MHSCLNRAQSVFGSLSTIALVVSALCAATTLLFPTTDTRASVQLKNAQIIKGRPHYYSSKRDEYAQLRFDLDTDLRPLFNWNTKQVFVYVYAAYSSSDRSDSMVRDSEAIVWDTILPASPSPFEWDVLKGKAVSLFSSSTSSSPGKKSSKRISKQKEKGKEIKNDATPPGVLRLRGQKSTYQIRDITGRLAERQNVTLSVGWNVQPWVGALWWSPGTGAVPRTEGTVIRAAAFDFPPLKGSKKESEKEKETATGRA